MAKVKKNPVIEGLSGGVGKLVFKQYGDKTVVCKWPKHDPNRQPTAAEAHQRGRIKEAAARAKAILATEEGKVYYEAARKRLGKHSAYHTAVFDFFDAPQVLQVDWGADDVLLIRVWDNVGVKVVRVLLDGEMSLADPVDETLCEWWRFAVGARSVAQVQIFAEDWMGNVGEKNCEWLIVNSQLLMEKRLVLGEERPVVELGHDSHGDAFCSACR